MTCYNDIYNLCASCDHPFIYTNNSNIISITEKSTGKTFNLNEVSTQTIESCDHTTENIAIDYGTCYKLYIENCSSYSIDPPSELSQINQTISILNDTFNYISNNNITTTGSNNLQLNLSSSEENLIHLGNIGILTSLLYEQNQSGIIPPIVDPSGNIYQLNYDSLSDVMFQYFKNTANTYYTQQDIQQLLKETNNSSDTNNCNICDHKIPKSFDISTTLVPDVVVDILPELDPDIVVIEDLYSSYTSFEMGFSNSITGYKTNLSGSFIFDYDPSGSVAVSDGKLSATRCFVNEPTGGVNYVCSLGLYMVVAHNNAFQIGYDDFTIEVSYTPKTIECINPYLMGNQRVCTDPDYGKIISFSFGGLNADSGGGHITWWSSGYGPNNSTVQYVPATYGNSNIIYTVTGLNISLDNTHHFAMSRWHLASGIDAWAGYFDGTRVFYEEAATRRQDDLPLNINNQRDYGNQNTTRYGTELTGVLTYIMIGSPSGAQGAYRKGYIDNIRFTKGVARYKDLEIVIPNNFKS